MSGGGHRSDARHHARLTLLWLPFWALLLLTLAYSTGFFVYTVAGDLARLAAGQGLPLALHLFLLAVALGLTVAAAWLLVASPVGPFLRFVLDIGKGQMGSALMGSLQFYCF